MKHRRTRSTAWTPRRSASRSSPSLGSALRRRDRGAAHGPFRGARTDAMLAARAAQRKARARSVGAMPCLAVVLAIISPRLALVVMAIFTDVLSRAFDSVLLPLLGFFVLPWTTLAYAVMWDVGTHDVTGFEWFVVVLAFLADLGAYESGRRSRDD